MSQLNRNNKNKLRDDLLTSSSKSRNTNFSPTLNCKAKYYIPNHFKTKVTARQIERKTKFAVIFIVKGVFLRPLEAYSLIETIIMVLCQFTSYI